MANRKKKEVLEDFDSSMLPETRKAQFLYLVKTKFLSLLNLGALMVLFGLPMIGVAFLKVYSTSKIYTSYDAEHVQGMLLALRSNAIMNDALQILGYIIFSLGLAGSMGVIKKMGHDELLFIRADFLKGIKENGLHFAICSLMFSLLVGLVDFLSLNATYANNGGLKIGVIILVGVFLFALTPIILMTSSSIALYRNSLGRHLHNSALISTKHYFPYVLFSLLGGVFFLMAFLFENIVPNGGIMIPVFGLLILYPLPLFLLGNHLCCLSYFDREINQSYPEIYHKGLSDFGKIED